ncbi:MAG TPA: hypothetical protein VMF13_06530, partial [Luteitalea sp.]|nr:hypothetical protein [Luteitalea sp.]
TGPELADQLARNKPRIAVGSGGRPGGAADGTTSVSVTAWMMQPGDDAVVADRLHALLTAKRPARTTDLKAPTVDITGRWDVEIAFASSTSKHTLFLEQKGNWLQGSHQGDFTVRDVAGMVEGGEVVIRSVERRPGSSITFTFSGTATGDTLSGPIHMGEYLTATYKATRHAYPQQRTRLTVPQGPPLSS